MTEAQQQWSPDRDLEAEAARKQAIVSQAGQLLAARRFDAALELLESSLRMYPGSPELWALKARSAAARSAASKPTRIYSSPAEPEPAAAPQAAPIVLDDVRFTLTAPSALAPGSYAEFYFWIHRKDLQEAVLRQAMDALQINRRSDMFTKSEGPFALERGASLTVRVAVDGITIDHPEKRLVWDGEIGNVSFLLAIPASVPVSPRKASASVRVNGCEIAVMDFLLHIQQPGAAQPQMEPVPATVRRYKTAFASYASQDRDEVIARVQGMTKAAPDLDVFLDVVNLRSNDAWEQQIRTRIPHVDVFYLFWCSHARDSEWVQKEWRLALASRGADFIDPVPLESPESAPPPDELSTKHFYEPVLAFMKKPHIGTHR